MTSVMITAAGGGGSIEIIKSLQAKGYSVIGVDSSKYAGGFAFTDRSFTVPPASDPAFRAAITKIITETRPEFIAPLVDEEIPFFIEIAKDASAPPFMLLAPSPEFCGFSLDKWLTFQNLRRVGVSIPDTELGSMTSELEWPAVVKPRQGRGGREVGYVKSQDELRRYMEHASARPEDYVVQKQMRGTEFTVSVVVALDGSLLAVVPKEVIIKKGITLAGVTRVSPAIDRLCRDIHGRLDPRGPFNVQLIVDDTGQPYVIEVNPRYSTTVALTMAAGVDEVDEVIRHALGEKVGQLPFEADLLMVRHYVQQYVRERDWPPRPQLSRNDE